MNWERHILDTRITKPISKCGIILTNEDIYFDNIDHAINTVEKLRLRFEPGDHLVICLKCVESVINQLTAG